ncbi:MAG TPA: Gfo/Idh/MocA family oxidoreductase [Solirubrobacteraceae bacterium]|nr:Gfo/Idh/MocA family oxidoreductase [Solirubrobacteraceae bacterium]
MRVKWGIVSTAHINRLFLAGARQSDGLEILAVASRDQARADEYARENRIERAYGSYDALLKDPDIDAVYISLPNSMHVDVTIEALEAGKHVLCEKPLSRHTSEVERAFDTAERNDRLLMEAFMWRHNPQTRRLTELVEERAIGRIRIIRAAFGFVTNDLANVRLSRDLDGGALMDVGCYCVSGARLIAGEPERVAGEQALGGRQNGVDVAFAGVMRFADDVTAHFDAGLALASRDLLEVVGDEGTLRLTDPWHCRQPGIDLIRGNQAERIEIEAENSYRLEAENLSAAIRGEGQTLLGRADAVGQASTIEALYRAADTGQTVSLCS